MSCSKIISLFNPCSKQHHALKEFTFLKREEKIVVKAITSVVALLSFGLLAVVVFRGLVKKFSAKQLLPHQKIKIQKINHLSKKTIHRPQPKSIIEDINLSLNQPPKQKIEIPKQHTLEKQPVPLEEKYEIKNLDPHLNRGEKLTEDPSKNGLDKIPQQIEKMPFPLNHEEKKFEIKDLDPSKDQKSVKNPAEDDKKEVPVLPNQEPLQPIHNEQDLENKVIQDMLEKAGIQNINDFVNADNDTLLKQLVIKNDIEMVKILLKHEADPNIHDKFEDLPLHYAAALGHLELVKILAPKTQINAQGQLKKTALSHAIRKRKVDADIVECLLSHGADPNIPNQYGALPLHGAALFGENEVLRLLLLKTKDINAQDNQKNTALYYTIQNNFTDVAKLLLEKNANVNFVYQKNNLAIHLAAKNNNLDLVKLLLPHLKDVNVQNEDQETVLNLLASKTDDIEIFKALLEKKADANIPDRNNNIPLHHAACRNLEIVKLLTCYTKNINASDNSQFTSLHHAVYSQKEEIVDFLLSVKADAGIPSENGSLPLSSAIFLKNLKLVKSLIPHTKPLDSKFLFDALDSPDILKELLAHGIDANIQDEDGDSLLHNVLWRKKAKELLEILLPKIKNIDVLTKENLSPLHLAIQFEETAIAKILLDHGADVELPGPDGALPLDMADATENEELIKLVLQRYLDKQDESKKTKLHHAAISKNREYVEALLKNGASANIQDNEGQIALHYAVLSDTQEITQLLIPTSNIDVRNNEGYTPLFLAVLLKREEIVKILLENGADKKIVLKDGLTIPALAMIMKNQKIIELLMKY